MAAPKVLKVITFDVISEDNAVKITFQFSVGQVKRNIIYALELHIFSIVPSIYVKTSKIYQVNILFTAQDPRCIYMVVLQFCIMFCITIKYGNDSFISWLIIRNLLPYAQVRRLPWPLCHSHQQPLQLMTSPCLNMGSRFVCATQLHNQTRLGWCLILNHPVNTSEQNWYQNVKQPMNTIKFFFHCRAEHCNIKFACMRVFYVTPVQSKLGLICYYNLLHL